MSDSSGKLKLGALVALVVGSMIGGGIFSLPQNMAASAGVGAVLIGWAITAVGMLTLAFVFQTLANRKPDLDGGVYAYAKAGFGDYMGFSSAWGYWISAWLGNVGYFVLLFSTLGYFFPVFGEGNTLPERDLNQSWDNAWLDDLQKQTLGDDGDGREDEAREVADADRADVAAAHDAEARSRRESIQTRATALRPARAAALSRVPPQRESLSGRRRFRVGSVSVSRRFRGSKRRRALSGCHRSESRR